MSRKAHIVYPTYPTLQRFIDYMAELNLTSDYYPYFQIVLCKEIDKAGMTPAEIVYEVFQSQSKPTDYGVFNELLQLGFVFRAEYAYQVVNYFELQNEQSKLVFDPEKFIYVQCYRLFQIIYSQQFESERNTAQAGDFFCSNCKQQFTTKELIYNMNFKDCKYCGSQDTLQKTKQTEKNTVFDIFKQLFEDSKYLLKKCQTNMGDIKMQFNSIYGYYREKLERMRQRQNSQRVIRENFYNELHVDEIFGLKCSLEAKERRYRIRIQMKQKGYDSHSIYLNMRFYEFYSVRKYNASGAGGPPAWFEDVIRRSREILGIE